MHWLVIGGEGFIGSHLAARLTNPRVFDLKNGDDARNLSELTAAMGGVDAVACLAANPDLAAAQADPDLDYRDGTVITRNTLEAMRVAGVRRLVFPSGSGVYGDQGDRYVTEADISLPVSPYGAAKLASEAMIAAYEALGFVEPLVVRLANVTGPGLTHGVVYDFVRKLRKNPNRLEILGNGLQSKHYVHVSDVVDVMLSSLSGTFNVAPDDYLRVVDIAAMCVERFGDDPFHTTFTGGAAGWPGDVPVVRMNTDRLRATGWMPKFTAREAVMDAIRCA